MKEKDVESKISYMEKDNDYVVGDRSQKNIVIEGTQLQKSKSDWRNEQENCDDKNVQGNDEVIQNCVEESSSDDETTAASQNDEKKENVKNVYKENENVGMKPEDNKSCEWTEQKKEMWKNG